MDAQQLRVLIVAARGGDDGAYERLLAAYGPRLYGYFYRAVRSHHDAEDLLGELMLRLVRRLPDYDDRGRFEPWLFSVAANLLRDRIRRVRTRPRPMSLEAGGSGGPALADVIAGRDEPVEAGMVRREAEAAVMKALEGLDEQSRHMVLLRHFGQMSFREIAEVFDCPLGTVLAKVHRALRTLRGRLEAGDESE